MNQQQGRGRSHHQELTLDDLHDGLQEAEPARLLAIIHSLLDKSKVLIQSLERSIVKLEACEKQTEFWKERYYAFKRNCELYVSGDLQFLEVGGKRPTDQQIKILREQNQSLKVEVELLRQNCIKQSPQFGISSHNRYLSNEQERTSFGKDSRGPWQSDSKADSQLSTDRHHQQEERMGPKHISFFRFSNKKRGERSGTTTKLNNIADDE